MESRGVIDVETALTLKSLLEISGPHHFVQSMVKVSRLILNVTSVLSILQLPLQLGNLI
jgi:hypothetical protein